jgi:hypothetical protein
VRKYPLQPLQKQREQAVNRDAVQLTQAKQQVELASRAHSEAEERHHAAVERAMKQRVEELGRVRGGRARAADLLQQAKHDVNTRREIDELQRAQASADEQLQQARHAADGRVQHLQQSAASAKASSEHRRRWEQAERKRLARLEDENAHEAWQAGHFGSKPSGSGRRGSGGV